MRLFSCFIVTSLLLLAGRTTLSAQVPSSDTRINPSSFGLSISSFKAGPGYTRYLLKYSLLASDDSTFLEGYPVLVPAFGFGFGMLMSEKTNFHSFTASLDASVLFFVTDYLYAIAGISMEPRFSGQEQVILQYMGNRSVWREKSLGQFLLPRLGLGHRNEHIVLEISVATEVSPPIITEYSTNDRDWIFQSQKRYSIMTFSFGYAW